MNRFEATFADLKRAGRAMLAPALRGAAAMAAGLCLAAGSAAQAMISVCDGDLQWNVVVVSVSLSDAVVGTGRVVLVADRMDKGANVAAWTYQCADAIRMRKGLVLSLNLEGDERSVVYRVNVSEGTNTFWSEPKKLIAGNKDYPEERANRILADIDRQRYRDLVKESIGVQERMQYYESLIEGRTTPDTWQEWMSRYDGKVLDPPIVFDALEPQKYDRTNLIAMTKWYWHKAFSEDTNALVQCSDALAKKEVVCYGVLFTNRSGIVTNGWKALNGGECTTMKILYTGEYRFEKYHLYCVVSRRQHSQNPLAHKAYFEGVVFDRTSTDLWIVGEYLGSFGPHLNLPGGLKDGQATFQELETQRTNSAMPRHFFEP